MKRLWCSVLFRTGVRLGRLCGTQTSSNQVCYFADVQKPLSENMPAVSFPPQSPCWAAGGHCGIAGVRRGLPLSALHKHLASAVFAAAAA